MYSQNPALWCHVTVVQSHSQAPTFQNANAEVVQKRSHFYTASLTMFPQERFHYVFPKLSPCTLWCHVTVVQSHSHSPTFQNGNIEVVQCGESSILFPFT